MNGGKANLAPMTEHPIDRFHWSPGEATLTGEAAELDMMPGLFQRVFRDACDEGIAIRGKGDVQRFVLIETHRDLEGDVQYWRLEAIDPRCPARTVLIFND